MIFRLNKVLFLLFYGKKVGKKPTTNEKLQFALTHTPTPQAVKLKFRAIRGRLRTVYALRKVSLSVYTFFKFPCGWGPANA